MLSHHEISTMLLLVRAPYQVEADCADLAALQRQELVEVELLDEGRVNARLTRSGREAMRRLLGIEFVTRLDPAEGGVIRLGAHS
jgi:hypothetical protein